MEENLLREKAQQKAFRLLTVRARSEKELRLKLREKGFEESVVGAVTARLLELKYLDDEAFAKQWARNLAVNRLLGDRRIEASLREKGVPRPFIEQAVAEVRKEFTEQEAVRALIGKKERKSIVAMDDKAKRRLAQRLMGKGFSPDLIYNTLNTPKEEYIDEGE